MAAGCAWFEEWPHVLTIDQVHSGTSKTFEVIVPGWLPAVGGVDAGKDNHGRVGADVLAEHGQRLVVRNPEGEFGDRVRGRRCGNVGVDTRMRAYLAR